MSANNAPAGGGSNPNDKNNNNLVLEEEMDENYESEVGRWRGNF